MRIAQHGTESKYSMGCRCQECKSGHAAYAKKLYRIKRVRGWLRSQAVSREPAERVEALMQRAIQ
jgi:hypothetical protein